MAIIPDDVREILPSGVIFTDAQLQAAIDAATIVVEKFSESYCGEGYTDAQLDVILKYLSAHFAAVTDNTLSLSSESSDGCCKAQAAYGFKFGEGIKGTPFGQMANTLSGGCLAEWDKRPSAIFSIGTHNGYAEDYFI